MTRWKDRPFSLIGVNVNEFESKNLKERMAEEKMNWRSFAYQEAVNAKWNPGTPGYYAVAAVVYRRALGRTPTGAEESVARELVGEAPTAAGVADLLWAVVMLPEFQLIR